LYQGVKCPVASLCKKLSSPWPFSPWRVRYIGFARAVRVLEKETAMAKKKGKKKK